MVRIRWAPAHWWYVYQISSPENSLKRGGGGAFSKLQVFGFLLLSVSLPNNTQISWNPGFCCALSQQIWNIVSERFHSSELLILQNLDWVWKGLPMQYAKNYPKIGQYKDLPIMLLFSVPRSGWEIPHFGGLLSSTGQLAGAGNLTLKWCFPVHPLI